MRRRYQFDTTRIRRIATPRCHTLDMDPLLDALKKLTGRDNAAFRPHQREAVEALVAAQRVLVVQRTGWGKSAVYFLATHLLREQGYGPTLLISRLKASSRANPWCKQPKRKGPILSSSVRMVVPVSAAC